MFEQFVPLNWTEAEHGDLTRYDGSEYTKFHRNSGTFKPGLTVRITDWKTGDHFKSPEHFSAYRKEEIGFTAGDLIRFYDYTSLARRPNIRMATRDFDAQGEVATAVRIKDVTPRGEE